MGEELETSGTPGGVAGPESAVAPAPVAASPAAGKLSVVGTPIGNLQDASPRVIRTLAEADVVLCEDTRVTAKLLSAFDLHVRLERCDENIIAQRVPAVLSRIEAGERVAFVSDAGMPGVSDPGQKLVDAALDAGLPVEVVPGPSAVTCALVASGLASEHFFFEGFLPRKKSAQVERLNKLAFVPGALVIYESPRRVAATLANVAEVFPLRRAALVRELTKLHEECVRGPAPELAARIAEREEVRGECVIVIAAPTSGELEDRRRTAAGGPATVEEAIAAGLAVGEPKSSLAKRLAREFGLPKSEVYNKVIASAPGAEAIKLPRGQKPVG